MEYSVNRLRELSGVSARTLRYYDGIGLLKPARVAESGYRVYGEAEVDRLQQILFHRELGFSLEEIKALLSSPRFDREQAFRGHLAELRKKRERLDALIETVAKSIAAMKGENSMTDKEKFEGFKRNLVKENEERYGGEIRERYGDAAVEASNARLMGLSEEQYGESERVRLALEGSLKAAFESGDPAGELARGACELHKQWLAFFTQSYSKEYHKGLGELYAADERFRANYDRLGAGCAEFFRDAINLYCEVTAD